MPRTQQERFEIALQSLGETIVRRTAKYICMTRLGGGFYFLGSSGSLRYGRNKTTSVPVGDLLKSALLDAVPANKRATIQPAEIKI